MFRNFPRKYTSYDLLNEIALHVDAAMVDFVYLPWNSHSHNMGYAFVNFVCAEAKAVACERMDGKIWQLAAGSRCAKILPASVHGLVANVELCAARIGRCEDQHVFPLVFLGGRQVDFQDALRILRGGGGAAAQPGPPRGLSVDTPGPQAQLARAPPSPVGGSPTPASVRLPRLAVVASSAEAARPLEPKPSGPAAAGSAHVHLGLDVSGDDIDVLAHEVVRSAVSSSDSHSSGSRARGRSLVGLAADLHGSSPMAGSGASQPPMADERRRAMQSAGYQESRQVVIELLLKLRGRVNTWRLSMGAHVGLF